jgi:hypothetical protein
MVHQCPLEMSSDDCFVEVTAISNRFWCLLEIGVLEEAEILERLALVELWALFIFNFC